MADVVDRDPVRWRPTRTYVYFIRCNSFVKIGVAQRPLVRLSTLQVGNPYKCKLIGVIKFESKKDAENQEEIFHKKLNPLHKRGEWFKIDRWLKKRIEEWCD